MKTPDANTPVAPSEEPSVVTRMNKRVMNLQNSNPASFGKKIFAVATSK